MRKWSWVVGVAGLLLSGVAIWVYLESGYLYTTKAEVGLIQAQYLVKQCVAYRELSGVDGKYPVTLLELVEPDPKSGRKPRMDGGKVALLDPWGERQYRYAVVETEIGPVPYVWFEYETDGRVHLIGAKYIAGKIRNFGPPCR